MKISIYYIMDKNNIPLYVGKTKNSLLLRESQYRRRLNQEVFIFELDIVNKENWKFWECYWINQFKSWGFVLRNKNKGGGGPEFHTKETRNKMSNTLRPETSNKLSGRKRPDVSKRLKGSKFSLETCLKISKAKKGTKYSEERNKKIRSSNEKHYKLNSKRNKKISTKLKGRDMSHAYEKRKKPILQFSKKGTFIKEWDSATLASMSLKKQSSAISECCSGKRKSAYNFIWKFKNL